jgi:hypothetical protein
MPTDMSPREEHKGTRHFLAVGAIALLVIGVGAMLWPRAPRAPVQSRLAATSGLRSDRTVGEGTGGGFPAVPPTVAPHSSAPATVAGGEDLPGPPLKDLALDGKQRKTIDNFATRHAQDRVDNAGFSIAVGATVPGNIQLHGMPISLADALPAYLGDQYFLAPKQFVIVEELTRRVLAIIPVSA